jgi:hypothetical protein
LGRKAKKSSLAAVVRQNTPSAAAHIASMRAAGLVTDDEIAEAVATVAGRDRSQSSVTPIFSIVPMTIQHLHHIERECASIAERAAKTPSCA